MLKYIDNSAVAGTLLLQTKKQNMGFSVAY